MGKTNRRKIFNPFLISLKFQFVIFLALPGFFTYARPNAAQSNPEVTFKVKVNCNTPEGEVVCIRLIDWSPGLYALEKNLDNEWTVTLKTIWSLGETFKYKYCRNYMDYGADEAFGSQNEMGWRSITITSDPMIVNDNINKWRWWPIDGEIPDVDTSSFVQTSPGFLPRPTFIFGINLPDFWWPNFAPVVEPTIDKTIIKSRASWIQYNPICPVTQFDPEPKITRDEEALLNGTPEANLIKIITESHRRGLKVYLNPSFWPIVTDPSPNSHTDEWWRKYYEQCQPIMTFFASVAQINEVELISFPAWNYGDDISNEEVRIIDNYQKKLLEQVRQIYKGQICIEYPYWKPEMAVAGLGDFIGGFFWFTLPIISLDPPVEEILRKARKTLDIIYYDAYVKWGKPLIINQVAACSFDGFLTDTIDFQEHLYYEPDDLSVPLDLQEQADAYEAYLNAILERSWIKGVFSFNYNYWDSLDKAPSIRAKPAEQVVAKWFQWLNPNNLYLSIVSSAGGTTNPAPGAYIFYEGASVSVQAVPATAYEFDNWSGDAAGLANPVTVVMNGNKTIKANFTRVVKPPLGLTGEKLVNRSVSMVEYVVRLRWQPNATNTGAISYRIYQIESGQATAIADVGEGTYEYIVRRLQATQAYRFGVTAVNSQGWESDMVEVAVQ